LLVLQLNLFFAEAIGYHLGTQSLMNQAACLAQVARMARCIDVAVTRHPEL
jgi:hypothetical protein